jgi:photosystem II stability/assembly factor-like uncharacterized protein
MPTENDFSPLAVNSWVTKGPFGMKHLSSPTAYNSGRILDIELYNGTSLRIAAASGGIWIAPNTPISEGITSQAIGCFVTKPGDANTIFAGTGEYQQRSGTGLWQTTIGGTSWKNIILTPTPVSFFRVAYDPLNVNKIHAATESGYFRSDNGGLNWTMYLTGVTSDLAINPVNSNFVYTIVINDGVYKSTNGGNNWTRLTTGGIPTSDIGRSSVSICTSTPNTVYLNISKNSTSQTLGVYKTTNNGTNWTSVTPSFEFHWGQGWYNCHIAVNPVNPNIVLAGGGSLIYTSNGGTTWNDFLNSVDPLYDPENIHADQHHAIWNSTGTVAYASHDGGLSTSTNGGKNWTTTNNTFPITQYVNFDVGGKGQTMFGGSQDNGISGTSDGGNSWWFVLGGDGGGCAIDPDDASKFVVTDGVFGGNWAFRRLLTTNSGSSFSFIDNGIPASGQWYHKIRNDKVSPVYLYHNSDAHVYMSTNYGTSWTATNSTAFPTSTISNLTASFYTPGGAVLYACLPSTNPSSKLRVYDNGVWYERSSGFISNVTVRTVAPLPTNNNIAYALMDGLTSTQKVYKTNNRGINWVDITGNLPNVPMADLIAHPTDNNKLYLGTEMGCFRTTNGGVNWMVWNNGMPAANIISEMNYIDSISINGKFYVVAATYGRGIFMREISGDDPIAVNNITSNAYRYELMQNYPNPFNPSTTIKFSLPVRDFVDIKIFDIAGREMMTLISKNMSAGAHEIKFDASKFSSGIYFYRMKTEKYSRTMKMILIK